jgi:alpha-ketoglutarate-dependent 2,4-dichlorophenoxyacetate dioxygenase
MRQARVKLDLRPLSPVLGAEVLGVDLAQAPDDALFAALRDAFLRFQLLVFRNQVFNDTQHVAFARRWGKVQRHVLSQYVHEGNPEIFVITNLDGNGNPKGEHPDPGAKIWHTDGSWAVERGLCTMLYSIAQPKTGGDTLYANMHAAYNGLSKSMKRKLEGLRAVHDLDYSRRLSGAKQQMTEEQKRAAPPVEHGIVRVHPETGRKCLYLGQHASHVAGMPLEEGRALVAELNAHCTQPRYTYTYRWSVGDAVMWDNRCLLHSATEFDWMNDVRVLRRTTTVGETIAAGTRTKGPD